MSDYISNLSDDLLCHILSFLPIKDSVRTSVLSRRWSPHRSVLSRRWCPYRGKSVLSRSPLWTRLRLGRRRFHFVQFVNTVLIFGGDRVLPQELFKCRRINDLYCLQRHTSDCLAAISKDVEHLRLDLPKKRALPPPPHALPLGTSLAVLKINAFNCEVYEVRFPSLKILHLVAQRSRFLDCFQITTLLSRCPVLEELALLGELELAEGITSRFRLNLPKLRVLMLAVNYKSIHAKEWICGLLRKLYGVEDLGLPCEARLDCLFYNFQLLAEPPLCQYPCDDVATALFKRLKVVQFINFHGTERELQVVSYVMKNAKKLKAVRICSAETLNANAESAKQQILTDLSAFPRCSERSMDEFYMC